MLKAIKLETSDISACESFFGQIFGFEVIHRYGGGAGDPFEEIVMTLGGEDGTMLKFVRYSDRPARATGACIQIRLDDIERAIAAATAAQATVKLVPTDYLEAGVCMAVITTNQGLDIELVREL